MRWMYLDPRRSDEASFQAKTLEAIDAWWHEFQKRTDDLDALFTQSSDWPLAEWMTESLGRIDPALMWEFGPAVHTTGHRLVITPEQRRDLRPLVRSVIAMAPRIPGWEFYEYRQPDSFEMTVETVAARCDGRIEGVLVEPSLSEGRLIDLRFLSPHATSEDDEVAHSASFIATETLLGEQVLDHWVGTIETVPLNTGWFRKRPRGRPLDRLRDTVDALILSVNDQLPDTPHSEQRTSDSGWSTIELQPSRAEDYIRQQDLLVAVTANTELWIAAHSGYPFYSARFSRCGETFCYLKIDGINGLGGSVFGDRGDIEEAINAVLRPDGLGISIGGGTGLRYSYIDLALADIPQSVERIREILLEGRIPHRAWIEFHDEDLRAEWIGIYDDTPPPPL